MSRFHDTKYINQDENNLFFFNNKTIFVKRKTVFELPDIFDLLRYWNDNEVCLKVLDIKLL